MITPKVDRSRQNNGSATGRFGEAGKKIIARHDRGAVSDGSQEFLEIFTAQRPPVLLVAKHHRVVEVENDATIGALKKTELEVVKAACFEKNDHVVSARFFEHAQPLGHARTSRRDARRLDAETGIVIKTISQTQPRAGSVTMFNDTKYFHSSGCEESLFLQLPCLPFQRLRSRSSRRSAIAR